MSALSGMFGCTGASSEGRYGYAVYRIERGGTRPHPAGWLGFVLVPRVRQNAPKLGGAHDLTLASRTSLSHALLVYQELMHVCRETASKIKQATQRLL